MRVSEKKTKQLDKRSFACGVAMTLAELVRLHGQDTMAADILQCTGMAEEVARYADTQDYYFLKLAEPSLRRPNKRGVKTT